MVVTYNSAATIVGLLDSLDRQGDALNQVVIRDNGSVDDTLQRVQDRAHSLRLPVVVQAGSNLGFAGGVAAALDYLDATDARPVLVVNPDVRLADGSVGRMLDVMRTLSRTGVVTAPLVRTDGSVDTASRRRLPTLINSGLYAVLGRLTPARVRYNAVSNSPPTERIGDVGFSSIEATTGALMLVNPDFRDAKSGIFDQDYWMYGEDLQLCHDARDEGWGVIMAEIDPSLHFKGVSSGLPRNRTSDQAFHRALYLYYRKNLRRNRVESVLVALAIAMRYLFSRLMARCSECREAAGRVRAGRAR